MKKLLHSVGAPSGASLARFTPRLARPAATLGIAGLFASLATSAFAQFGTIAAQNVDNLLGVSTSGSETGIYEMVAIVGVGLLVAFGVVISFTGFGLAKSVVKMVRR